MAGSPPHTPFPPVTSSDPKTASPTLNVQIPLILLGRRGVNNDWDFGPERYSNRLKIIHQALQEFCPDIDVAVWVPSVFEEEDGEASSRPVKHEEDRMQLRKIVEERRAEWMEGERKRWVGFEERGGWVVRQTDRGDEAAGGVLGGWKEGNGLLTAVERGLVGDGVWVCSFTLQRFDINTDEKEMLEQEVEKVTAVLEKISGVELPQLGTMFRIICSERCWPRITFQPGRRASQTGTTAWEERTVCNLLLLQTAFERELLTFSTPTFLLHYWPLSHFLTHRAVRDMQRLRKEKWKKLGQGSKEGVGEKRKRKHWEREVSKWIEDLEWEDEKVEERERILGEGREAWWEALETSEMGTLVEQMSRFKGGLPIIFQQEGKTENERFAAATIDESSGESTEDKPIPDYNVDDADLYAPSIPNVNETSLPPSPHPTPSFPRIKVISFPVPRFSASLPSALLLAYMELISKLILFSHRNTEETVRLHIHELREINEQDDAQPLEQLTKLAKLLNISAPNLATIKKALSPYYNRRPPPSSDHHRKIELERLLADSPVDDFNIESSSPSPPYQPNLEGKDEACTLFVRHVEGFYRREREYVGRFVERYGRAGGFLVPRRKGVFGLMVGAERRRGDGKEGGEEEVVEGLMDESDG